MKVIHIDTGREWRGGQSQVWMLASGMRERGHDVVLAVRKGSPLASRAAEQLGQIKWREVPFRFEADPASAFQLSRLASQDHSYCLYHAHTPHALGLAILAQTLGPTCPIVFTRRVAFPVKSFFINRWKMNRADRIIAVSHAVEAALEKAGIAKDKIHVIHSAIDSKSFEYCGPNQDEPLNVVIAGAVEPAKGINEAMDFVERCGNLPVTFHFAGSGTDLERLMRWAENRPNVVVHGFVQDMPGLLRKMFGLISFSPSEGFPNTILQVLALGLPVLALENDAVREIMIRREWGSLFRSPEQAFAEIQKWVSNKTGMVSNGKEASKWILANYSQDHMVEKTLALYKEMLA